MGVARRCAKVVSMVMDVGVISMAMGWEEKGGGGTGGGGLCLGGQGRGTKDEARVIAATQTGNRRRALRGGRQGKKVQFHEPNYFGDGGEKNITVITASEGIRGRAGGSEGGSFGRRGRGRRPGRPRATR